MPRESGVRVFDVMHDLLTGKAAHTHHEKDEPVIKLASLDAAARHKTKRHAE